MKKLLLLMVAAVSTLAAWAYTETPIITYDYSDKYEPGYQETAYDGTHFGWSSFTTKPSFDNNGVLVFTGNNLSTGFTTMTPGLFICDLGGSINRVLTVNGSASKFGEKADALNFATNKKKQSTYTGYYNLWFFNNGTTETKYAKIRVVFSVCSTYSGSEEKYLSISVGKEVSTNYISNTTATTALNAFGGSDWDGTKWGVYECICSGLQAHASIKINTPSGGIGNQFALLIKSVEFIALDGASDADVKDASITIEDREVDINADHTTIALTGGINLKKVDVSSSKIPVEGTTSSDRYPTYYEEINALELPFTITPDINKVAEGKSLTANLNLLTNGNALPNSNNNLTVTVPAISGAPIACNFENILYRPNYKVQLNSVQYSTTTEGETTSDEAITKDFTTAAISSNMTRPSTSFTENAEQPVLFKIGTLNCVILQDSFTASPNNFAGYVCCPIKQEGDVLDAGILTENYKIGDNTYGVKDYASREETEDFVFTKHNWSRIMFTNGEGKIVLHVANISPNVAVTHTPTVYYPLYEKPEATADTNFSVDANSIQSGEINIVNIQASAEYSYTPSSDDIENAQTSVANVAVDASGKVEFYNLQGVKVAEDALTPGIYVRRAAGKAVKVIVK